MVKLEIDIGELQPGLYYLDINGLRLLATERLGEVMDRVEREVKSNFNIKEKKFGGFFKK